MSLFRVSFVVSVVTACASTANAAIIVSTSATAPTTDILASFDPGSDANAYFWRWTGNTGLGRVEMGPSFPISVATPVTLDKVTLRAREYGGAVDGAAYKLELWKFSSATDTIGDALLDTQTGVLPAGLAAPAWWTFDFDDITLAGGQQYGFLLSFDNGPDPGRFVHFVQDFVDGYTDGRLVSRAGTPPDWDFGGHDLAFVVQGTAAVPEPGTFLAAGAVALIAGRRCGRRIRCRSKTTHSGVS